jgi:hypothetical protein
MKEVETNQTNDQNVQNKNAYKINANFVNSIVTYLKGIPFGSVTTQESAMELRELIKIFSDTTKENQYSLKELDRLIIFMEVRPFIEVYEFFTQLKENIEEIPQTA